MLNFGLLCSSPQFAHNLELNASQVSIIINPCVPKGCTDTHAQGLQDHIHWKFLNSYEGSCNCIGLEQKDLDFISDSKALLAF